MTPAEKEVLDASLNIILEAVRSGQQDNSYKVVLYIVPIAGIVFGCTLLFFLFYWWHRQKLELIRKDQYRPFPFDFRAYAFFLGLLLTYTGFALTVVLIVVLGKSLAMLGGVIPLAIGLGLLSYYKLRR